MRLAVEMPPSWLANYEAAHAKDNGAARRKRDAEEASLQRKIAVRLRVWATVSTGFIFTCQIVVTDESMPQI